MEPSRTLIGVGGSAGAIEPLLGLLDSLLADLPAAVLADRLRRRSQDASHAADVIRSLLYRGDVARIDAPDEIDERTAGGELEQAG